MLSTAVYTSVPSKALEMSQFTIIHKDPKQIRRNQLRQVARMSGACLSFKDVILPGFLHPQSNPTPNVPVPLSFRIPGSWSEAKYKIKVAHS